MALYRNVSDEPLLVVVGTGLQRVEVDGVVDLPDDLAVQSAENGHPAPIWAPVATPKKAAKATTEAAPAAEED